MTWSDKTSLIARKYTHAYNGIYLLFCRCYSNCVSFIELLRMFASVCAKIFCSERVIKLERLKKFMAIRLVLSDRVTYVEFLSEFPY